MTRATIIAGARGSGKTWNAAKLVHERVDNGARRIALIGATREAMTSAIVETVPQDQRPAIDIFGNITWPNGAIGIAFDSGDLKALRGQQFDTAWIDDAVSDSASESYRLGVPIAAAWFAVEPCLRLGDPVLIVSAAHQGADATLDALSGLDAKDVKVYDIGGTHESAKKACDAAASPDLALMDEIIAEARKVLSETPHSRYASMALALAQLIEKRARLRRLP